MLSYTYNVPLVVWSKIEPKLHYQLLSLTADPVPTVQLHVRGNRIQTSGYPEEKMYFLIKLEAITIKTFHSQLMCY